jgi:hypothetical protein
MNTESTATERTYYADANGLRVGNVNAVFGEHTYATKGLSAVSVVETRRLRWPAFLVIVVGTGAIIYGMLGNGVYMIVGAAGLLSGTFNLKRKKPMFGVRIVTNGRVAFVLASPDKSYVEMVADATRKAISSARQLEREARV